jgi:mRNA-degrading endonuclease toxin of MazEF toxin-antitoxin module
LTGVVLADHLRSVDWIARGARFHGRAAQEVVDEVLGRIEAILFRDAPLRHPAFSV